MDLKENQTEKTIKRETLYKHSHFRVKLRNWRAILFSLHPVSSNLKNKTHFGNTQLIAIVFIIVNALFLADRLPPSANT
jgi:hypothetical protein